MSHEIRTPMNGVIGMTELLLETTRLDDQQREYAKIIHRSGGLLLDVINDVLDISKIEAERVDLENVDFDLHAACRDVTNLFTAACRSKRLTLNVDIDGERRYVRGDPTRLRQVLTNLVGNAVKFTSVGSVALVVRELEDGKHEFRIEDTGVGIPETALPRLFSPFTQTDESTTRRFGGTGLGLAICKSLCGLMGATLTVETSPDVGSTFLFAVRFEDGVAPARVREDYAAIPSDLRVLLAEDSRVNQIVATRMLESLGCTVTVAADGESAVRAAQATRFDIILMDCQMPRMDGFEAARLIRDTDERGDHMPIIALTANTLTGDRERCIAAGMDDYLTKPIELRVLAAALERNASPSASHDPGSRAPESSRPRVARRSVS